MSLDAAHRIESPTNPEVKALVRLRDRRHREAEGKLLIEGYREILRALDHEFPVETLYFAPELFLGDNEAALIHRAAGKGARLVRLSVAAFGKAAYRDRPEGLLALSPWRRRALTDLAPLQPALLVACEGLEKPGNLGTILRSADAAGAQAVICCDRVTDLSNPNVVRASTGALFAVPVAETSIDELIAWLKAHSVALVVASPRAERSLWQADLSGSVCLAFGAEQYGLSAALSAAADLAVRIPMRGCADSLNVAQAATVLLFEAQRQRTLGAGVQQVLGQDHEP